MKKISLTVAVLLAINTMIGGGIFVNTKPLTALAGPLGFFGYLISGLILLPLILSVAELARLHPVSGGLYVYNKTYLGTDIGFVSSWSYFLAKSISASFLIYTVASFFHQNIPCLQNIPLLAFDYFMIFFMITLNVLGVSVAGNVQYLFSFLKGTPILFVFVSSFLAFDATMFFTLPLNFEAIPSLIPIALYAVIGFEVICAIGGFIENPAENIRKAIMIAFFTVLTIITFFQFGIFAALGTNLASSTEPILLLAQKVFPNIPLLGRLINGLVFTSILGGAFSMLASNCWNFYTIAQNNHVPFKNFFTKLSKTNVPWVCIYFQGFIALFIISITRTQIALQTMSIFALFTSYLLTALAAYQAIHCQPTMKLKKWIPLCAVFACSGVLVLCFNNILLYGVSLPFLSIFLIGCLFALLKKTLLKQE